MLSSSHFVKIAKALLLAVLKYKRVRCPSILTKFTTYFCIRRVVYKKVKTAMLIKHCLTGVANDASLQLDKKNRGSDESG